MTTPKLLDLFCGAGGAGEGYRRAGFEVTGVDIKPQPRYKAGAFIQTDALDYVATHGWEYDAIHASPPCQAYSKTKSLPNVGEHPQLVELTRYWLETIGAPYVIENVIGAPLHNPITLCGTMFGLKVYRHRLFESNILLLQPNHARHNGSTGSHRGYSSGQEYICVAGHNFNVQQARIAMGIDWMSRDELSQSIPPVYTFFIGAQLMRVVLFNRERNCA